MSKTKHRIAVLGAGVIGVSTALALAEKGYAVSLIDQNARPAMGTSQRNGAQLSYAYADAMASPAMLVQSPRILLGLEDGIKFALAPSFYNLNWLTQFALQCTKSSFLRNTQAALALSKRSQSQMANWFERYRLKCARQKIGKLQLVGAQSSLDAAQKLVALKSQFDFDTKIISADEARALDPAVASFQGQLAGAIYTSSDEVADPFLFCQQALEVFLGLSPDNEFVAGAEITDLHIENGKLTGLASSNGIIGADSFVFALGMSTRRFERPLGLRTPIVSVAGYSVTLDAGDVPIQHSITDAAGKFVVCPLGDKIRVAGFADIGAAPTHPNPQRIEKLLEKLFTRFPGIARHGDDVYAWVGQRPMTPTSQPIIGRVQLENAWVNYGHGSLGWTLAAGSAAHLCAQIGESF